MTLGSDVENLLATAAGHLGAGRLEDALADFTAAAERDPESADAFYGVGFVCLSKQDHAEAERALTRALDFNPDHAKAANALGAALLSLGRAGEAEARFARAVTLTQAENPDFLVNHAMAALKAGRADAALSSIDRILDKVPNAAQAFLMKADALFALKRYEAAAEWAERACAALPGEATGFLVAGRIQRGLRRPGPAVDLLEKAAALSANTADILIELGGAYALCERAEEAAKAYRQAEENPDLTADNLANLAFGWDRLNDVAAMARCASRAVALDPEGYRPRLARARSLVREKDDAGATVLFDALTNGEEGQVDSGLWFAQGQCLDRLGQAEAAWTALSHANRLASETPGAADLIRKDRETLDRLIAGAAALSPSIVEPEARAETGEAPIFVIGFPRSGTTLVDRLLGAHPEVTVFEEKPLLERVEARFEEIVGPYPASLPRATATQAALLRDGYLADIRELGFTHGRILDKQPLNLKRVGLMRLLFPNSVILLVDRHPMDAVLSCFLQDFRLNTATSRFTDPVEAARSFLSHRALFESLVAGTGAAPLRLRYEDLIADPKAGITPVLDACGLAWHPAMADHRSASVQGRVVRSASYAQVSETIADRSVGRWRRYRPYLTAVEALLAETCTDLGYSLD